MNIKENNLILSLDVSTSTIGIALLTENRELLKVSHLRLKVPKKTDSTEGLFLKKKLFEEELCKNYTDKISKIGVIKHVIIEEPLLSSNNVNTVGVLLRFNGMISDCVYNILNVVPLYISSYDSRKYAFPELMAVRKKDKNGNPYTKNKIDKGTPVLFGDYAFDIDKKQVIWDKVNELFPEIEWIYDKNNKLIKENFDASDAVCVGLAFINKINVNKLDS